MSNLSQRHRETALPFPYCEGGLEFELEGYLLDGEREGELNLKPGQTHIDLTADGPIGSSQGTQPWEEVTLTGRIVLPKDDVVSTVFPKHERAEPPAKLYVAIRCHETIYRGRSLVSESPTAPGEHRVEITLEWSKLRGKVELRPYLVRAKRGGEIEEYATKPNVRLADGKIYTVLIDNSEREEQAFIDGEEISFSQSDHLPNGEKLYYLDFRNESQPKLWINSDNPRITDILQSDGSVGAEPRMRDVILDQISYGIWTQLIVRAACAVDDEGEVEHEWQRTVIESFARQLYDVEDTTDAALRLRDDVENRDQLPDLVGRIDGELQEYIDPRTQLINLVEEGLQI